MRRVSPALFIVPLLLAAPAGAETASQVFRQVSPSVVVVLTYDAAGKATELGSGVKLPDGSVATNCHVLKDGTTYQVRYRGQVYPASQFRPAGGVDRGSAAARDGARCFRHQRGAMAQPRGGA